MTSFLGSLLRRDRWPLWIGGAIGVLVLAWLLRGLDFGRFVEVARGADVGPLLLLPLAIVAEQLCRSLKWRLLLAPLRTVPISRLFAAIMVGYFANLVAPVRVSFLVRAWLVARSHALKVSTVLASVTIDRIIDGWVYLGLALVVVGTASFPDAGGEIRGGMWQGFAWSFATLAVAVAGLVGVKRAVARPPAVFTRIARRLPTRAAGFMGAVAEHFGRGLVLPQSGMGRAVILGAAVTMKALAASHLLWAGLAFGVVLAPMDYLFLMVFLGFIATLAGTLRIVGGFTAAGVFALGLFDVAVEQALAIALVVEAANHLTVAVVGGICFAVEGISLSDVRRLRGRLANQGDRKDECR